jgi:hypothetical protein
MGTTRRVPVLHLGGHPTRRVTAAWTEDMTGRHANHTAGLGEQDIHLFREGTHARLYRRLGCRWAGDSARFTVWAPNARAVDVVGDFNDWRTGVHVARPRADGAGCGRPRSRRRARPSLQVRHPHPGWRADREGRPLRAPGRTAAGHRLGGLAPTRGMSGATRVDGRARGRAMGWLRRCRCTSAPGVLAPRRGRSPARLPQRRACWPTTSAAWASRMSN